MRSRAAALFFALTSSRYERRSPIVSSNKTSSAWAEIFGDPVAVAAMGARLVHRAGSRYRSEVSPLRATLDAEVGAFRHRSLGRALPARCQVPGPGRRTLR